MIKKKYIINMTVIQKRKDFFVGKLQVGKYKTVDTGNSLFTLGIRMSRELNYMITDLMMDLAKESE